jgi:hypothetical protein
MDASAVTKAKLSREQVDSIVHYIEAAIAASMAKNSCGPHVREIRENALLVRSDLYRSLCWMPLP